jgi:uridine kinase
VSICGPAGAGKSQLAKAVAARVGPERCARVPTDYFLVPADGPLPDYLARPLRYDWDLLALVLALPVGTMTSTPDFDFARFQRLAETGGRPVRVCPLMLVDAMEPYPPSDARLLLRAPDTIRHVRIATRDAVWQTRVRDRWPNLEAAWAHASALTATYDLELDGTQPIAANAERVVAWLAQRFGTMAPDPPRPPTPDS